MEVIRPKLNLNSALYPPALACHRDTDWPDYHAEERLAAYVQSGKQHAGMWRWKF